MIRVGVVGYGTIGKRVADAIRKQDDMVLTGIVKTKPDYGALIADLKGIDIYTIGEDRIKNFENSGITVKGTVDDLISRCDLIVDATPKGIGLRNKISTYEPRGVRAIFQGGEKAEIADVSFVSLANFEEALGKKYVRVVSCNTTGIVRLIVALTRLGQGIKRVRVFIARRGADPKEYSRGPINDVVPDPITVPSHHALDVRSVLPHIDIVSMAIAVPVTLAHLHMVDIEFEERVSKSRIVDALYSTPRIMVVESVKGFTTPGQVVEWARDMGRHRYDIPENIIFRESISIIDNELYLFMAIHQESIVVPENIDAIRAMEKAASKWDSIRKTDKTLNLVMEGKRYE